MSEKENVGPAFPSVEHGHGGEFYRDHEGMTLRDWFAGQALAGIASKMSDELMHDRGGKFLAIAAYTLADAMIEARKK